MAPSTSKISQTTPPVTTQQPKTASKKFMPALWERLTTNVSSSWNKAIHSIQSAGAYLKKLAEKVAKAVTSLWPKRKAPTPLKAEKIDISSTASNIPPTPAPSPSAGLAPSSSAASQPTLAPIQPPEDNPLCSILNAVNEPTSPLQSSTVSNLSTTIHQSVASSSAENPEEALPQEEQKQLPPDSTTSPASPSGLHLELPSISATESASTGDEKDIQPESQSSKPKEKRFGIFRRKGDGKPKVKGGVSQGGNKPNKKAADKK